MTTRYNIYYKVVYIVLSCACDKQTSWMNLYKTTRWWSRYNHCIDTEKEICL